MNHAAVDWLKPNLRAAVARSPEDDGDHVRSIEASEWPTEDDVHFQAIAGDVRQAPGANSTDDEVTNVVRNILDRVRRNIRQRNGKA
jgi:hypothetical protein